MWVRTDDDIQGKDVQRKKEEISAKKRTGNVAVGIFIEKETWRKKSY